MGKFSARYLAWQKEGEKREAQKMFAGVCSLMQRLQCDSGGKQIPSLLMGQVELSVPELVKSVMWSDWHGLY